MSASLLERIQSPTPKKILACDGGGILGLISVEILAKLESDLHNRLDKPILVLADWFDFVGGTCMGRSSPPALRRAFSAAASGPMARQSL